MREVVRPSTPMAVVRYAAETVVGRTGDAASKLGTEFKASISSVPWRQVIGMRIIVDHAYHRIDPGRLWNTLASDLPALRQAIERHRGR